MRKTPLREQSFRYAALGVGLIIGLAVILLPNLVGGARALPPLVIVIAVVVALVVGIGGMALGLALGNRIVGDRIEGAMREPGGRWRHGRITVTPGHLSFQPYLWQVRIPHGAPVEFDVEELSDDTGRRPSWKQIMSVNPQLHIVDVVAPQGRRELAALPSHLEELRGRLAAPHQPVS
jgi:F0F1-type ATP synthase membrane subunit c/vacuolar-type H+-ATPase subunit K